MLYKLWSIRLIRSTRRKKSRNAGHRTICHCWARFDNPLALTRPNQPLKDPNPHTNNSDPHNHESNHAIPHLLHTPIFEKKRSAIRGLKIRTFIRVNSALVLQSSLWSLESGLSGDMIGFLADATDSLLRRCYWTAYYVVHEVFEGFIRSALIWPHES